MKLNQLLLLVTTSLTITTLPLLGHAAEISTSQKLNQAKSVPVVVAKAQTALASGKFIAAEKPTTGTARIVNDGGHSYLELDGAFSTSDQGPDLHVLLDTDAQPPKAYQNHGSYVNLGRLQKFNGSQRYPIPDVVKVGSFKSVVIWCRMANATFGYAPLQTGSN